LSSAGRRVGLLGCFRAALSALGLRGRLIALDAGLSAPAAHLADKHYQVPRCDDAGFAQAVAEICRRERPLVIVPTIDPELPCYAERTDELVRLGVRVACSRPEGVAIAADKRLTHCWLTRNGFPTVRQGGLEEVCQDVSSWDFPVIVKPAFGSASAGVRRVERAAELLSLRGEGRRLIVQEIARGEEYTVHTYIDQHGDCLAAVPCLRLEVRAGRFPRG
jgi:carbamoyl-phosphate synthase large subunit